MTLTKLRNTAVSILFFIWFIGAIITLTLIF